MDWWSGRFDPPGNRILADIARRLCDWIPAAFGVRTFHLPYHIERGGTYLKDAAVVAGLGCIGRNNLLVTRQYGPRVRLRALTLDADLSSTGAPAAAGAPVVTGAPAVAGAPPFAGRACRRGAASIRPAWIRSLRRVRCALSAGLSSGCVRQPDLRPGGPGTGAIAGTAAGKDGALLSRGLQYPDGGGHRGLRRAVCITRPGHGHRATGDGWRPPGERSSSTAGRASSAVPWAEALEPRPE